MSRSMTLTLYRLTRALNSFSRSNSMRYPPFPEEVFSQCRRHSQRISHPPHKSSPASDARNPGRSSPLSTPPPETEPPVAAPQPPGITEVHSGPFAHTAGSSLYERCPRVGRLLSPGSCPESGLHRADPVGFLRDDRKPPSREELPLICQRPDEPNGSAALTGGHLPRDLPPANAAAIRLFRCIVIETLSASAVRPHPDRFQQLLSARFLIGLWLARCW